jgi:ferredoxin
VSRVFKQQTSHENVGILGSIHLSFSGLIHHRPGKPSTYEANYRICCSSCLGCINPTCMRFSPDELRLNDNHIKEFPADNDDSVCPLNAIVWEREAQTPRIDIDRCMNCGICARRCPVGAIYSNGNTAIIHSGEPEVVFAPLNLKHTQMHNDQLSTLSRALHAGQYTYPDEASITNLYSRLSDQSTEAQFPNLIIRNIFLVLGNECIIRRRGDVYFRIDAIAKIPDNSTIIIIEVEFHKDSLESPRAILDDIAVLSSRYGIDKMTILPCIVSLELPNQRTEYWRVIKDIKDVLNIRINSLTLGALCILTWSFVDISIGTMDFYADVDSPSIRQQIVAACRISKSPKITSYAVLEPIK